VVTLPESPSPLKIFKRGPTLSKRSTRRRKKVTFCGASQISTGVCKCLYWARPIRLFQIPFRSCMYRDTSPIKKCPPPLGPRYRPTVGSFGGRFLMGEVPLQSDCLQVSESAFQTLEVLGHPGNASAAVSLSSQVQVTPLSRCYLTESVYKVVSQKSIPANNRQLFLILVMIKDKLTDLHGN